VNSRCVIKKLSRGGASNAKQKQVTLSQTGKHACKRARAVKIKNARNPKRGLLRSSCWENTTGDVGPKETTIRTTNAEFQSRRNPQGKETEEILSPKMKRMCIQDIVNQSSPAQTQKNSGRSDSTCSHTRRWKNSDTRVCFGGEPKRNREPRKCG